MPEKVEAPWTQDQVSSLNNYQISGVFHEFTCANEHDGKTILKATQYGWICDCGYTQNWAWDWMADYSWEGLRRWKS